MRAAQSASPPASLRLGSARRPGDARGAQRVQLTLAQVPVGEALRQLATGVRLQLAMDEAAVANLAVTLQSVDLPLDELLELLESLLPLTLERRGAVLEVRARDGPRLALLLHALPAGLVTARRPMDFASLEQLSFISRSQRAGTTDGGLERTPGSWPAPGTPPAAPADALSGLGATVSPGGALGAADDLTASHLEQFLARLPALVPWPEGSAWHLDRQRNLLFVRAPESTLDVVQQCLVHVAAPPTLIEIEARFVELTDGFARELGIEFGLSELFALDRDGLGRTRVALGDESGTRLGRAPLLPGVPSGLHLSVLGVLSQPRFEGILRALESRAVGEVRAAPVVAAVNNARATIAITRNLPYVEDYRPVFDTRVVASDGISSTESDVALVAVINDRNFTGIVLNVTPSVGSPSEPIHLLIQPVVRDQVDSITIADGALLEGGATPAITRPIIETRFVDTQLALENGGTVVLGGLRTRHERRETVGVPVLGWIPLLGRLFRRDVTREERRDLLIFVTARLVP